VHQNIFHDKTEKTNANDMLNTYFKSICLLHQRCAYYNTKSVFIELTMYYWINNVYLLNT